MHFCRAWPYCLISFIPHEQADTGKEGTLTRIGCTGRTDAHTEQLLLTEKSEPSLCGDMPSPSCEHRLNGLPQRKFNPSEAARHF